VYYDFESTLRERCMKILLATDGSRFSTRAASYLAKHRGVFGTEKEVVLLYVDPLLPRSIRAEWDPKEVARYHAEAAQAAMRSAKAALKALIGDPASMIVDVAKSGKFDLIVMGSHGRGALGSLILGSVTAKVIAQCTIPVLVVR